MSDSRHRHDAVHWHINEITSRIIAESGIPSDRFHLGKIIMQSLKDDPELVAQIDGSTCESETNASVLRRSTQCAIGFRKLGLQQAELSDTFKVNKPKIIFCESRKVEDIKIALNQTQLDAKIISFDNGSHSDTFTELLKLGDVEKEIQNYRAANIDPVEAISMLIATSGTTGLPKSAAVTHKNFAVMGPYFWKGKPAIPYITRSLVAAPLQWLSAIINYVCSPYMKITRIQSSLPSTTENIYHLINTYKPDFTLISPTMMTSLLKSADRDSCDFTCFKLICTGGSAVYLDLIKEIKLVTPETEAICVYGMSELSGMAFLHGLSSPPHSCGKPKGCFEYRVFQLVDPETGKEINEPHKNGELWLKGPTIFKGYYNNPEATKEVFTEDGWFKTGDMLYRDDSWNYFFVERIKLLLKYRNHQISPVELEGVIIQHPGVMDVAVTGIPDLECGDLPVACVVRRPGFNVSAQEIKDLIKETLTETKQLSGGVVFMNELPVTASTKLHRRKIKEMVLNMKRE